MKYEMTQWKCFVQTHLHFVAIYGLMWSSSVTFKHKMTLMHSNVSLVTRHHFITACKRSCGNVIFSQVSVILFTGGVCLVRGGGDCYWGGAWSGGVCSEGCLLPGGCLLQGVPGPGGVCSRGVSAPRGVSARGCLVETPPDGYCCGRYASYWNAFLSSNDFTKKILHSHTQSCYP